MIPYLELRLDSISVTNAGFIVFLKGDDENRVLPIFIGANEAQAIALALGDDPPARPLTHDLLKNMLDALDAVVTRVDIVDLREGTFFARVHVARGDLEVHEFDSRPSDAIALAVRYDAPIFVTRTVFDDASIAVVVKNAAEDADAEDDQDAENDPEAALAEAADEHAEIERFDPTADDDESPLGDDTPEVIRPTPAAAAAPLSPLEKLQADLKAAVRDERYEEAARLRDVLKKMGGN